MLENLLLLNGLNSTTMIIRRTYKIFIYFILIGQKKQEATTGDHSFTLDHIGGKIEFVCIIR
jgi:hypothetical protein